MSVASMKVLARENEARVLRAGRAIFAGTGRPPTLKALAARSGLAAGTVIRCRRRLVAEGSWPWPVMAGGDWHPRDRRGLTAGQARWMEAFNRAGLAGPLNLSALARERGQDPRVVHNAYRRLLAAGHRLPPLARYIAPSGERSMRREPPPPSPAAIARRAAAIRASRPPGPMGEPDGRMGRLMECPGALVFDHDESRSVRGV